MTNKHKPYPFYETETDSLICYFKDQKSYAKVISKTLTLLLSVEDDSIIGVEITGIKDFLRGKNERI